MSEIRREFEKAFDGYVLLMPKKDIALHFIVWALKKAEEACMSPTSKGRIRQLSKELGEP